MKRAISLAWLLLAVVMYAPFANASVSVSLTPTTVNVQPNGQVQFNAVVSGTSDNVVVWGLSGTTCTGAACGQITSTGLYTAPATTPASNVITVTATSLADLSASASAAVILGSSSDVKVSLSPLQPTVIEGQQQYFLAYVTGTTLTTVKWQLTGSACGTSDCGNLTQSGVYTAPPAVPSGQVIVMATSVADPTSSASTSVNVVPPVTVKLSPSASQVNAGLRAQFAATVTGTTNTAVTWSIAGAGCTGATCGSISTSGLYTAPAAVPSPAQVSVTATSVADPTKSSTATVTVIPPIAVSISPTTAQVLIGGHQQFTATVQNTTNTAVTWSVAGTGCTGSACGTISTSGLYTAPASAPSPAQVAVTATSVADPTKSSTASVTVILPVSVSISPTTAEVLTGGQQQFTATVLNATNTAVTWKVAGAGCTGAACGTISTSGLYTAPASAPSPAQVSVTATSVADPTKSSTATVTVIAPVSVSISPSTAQVPTGGQQQFTATVQNATNTSVTWSVAGKGCTGAACGTISTSGLYAAPATPPSPAQVLVTATSVADPTKSSTASVTVIPVVSVTISPKSAQVLIGGHQQFTATVLNATNTSVTWKVAGTGCTGAACGTISTSGLYTAPAAVPSPAQVSVTATSVADPTKSSTATVTVILPVSVSISPTTARVPSGGHQQFTATVLNTTNTSVTWSLAGAGCTGAACGTVSTSGLYTAPAAVPSPAQVSVTATSVADPTKSSTASVTVTPAVVVTISPKTAQVVTGAHQQFTATVLNTTNTSVTWSLAGTGCTGAACGTVSTSGLYTAPGTVPSPAQVSVTATSVADPTKSSTASVTVILPVSVSISPTTAQVLTGGHQQFTATVLNTTNTAVTWKVTGTGCTAAACGTISTSGLYTAPATAPSPAQVSVTATSVADPTKSSTAIVTITGPVVISIAPVSAQVVASFSQQFTAKVSGTSNTGVSWSVAGSGCSASSCGTISATGLYTAPGTVPSPAQVYVTVTSNADSTKSSTATVTIVPPITVSISPTTATVTEGATQQFTATVSGTSNTSVLWKVSGSGCVGSACGSVSSTGLYTAPNSLPSPAQVSVTATSVADPTKSQSAAVTIVPPVVVTVTPSTADVVTGAYKQFTASVTGTSNQSVTWSIKGSGCSGLTCGTITNSGLYGAPGVVPAPPEVTVTATSVADSSKSGSAVVTVLPPVAVTLSPTSAQVVTGESQQFTADVTGSSNTAVSWSVSGRSCSGSACGVVSSSGLYTAPAVIPNPAQVAVKATSLADRTKSATAAVTIIPPVQVTITPTTAVVVIGGQQQFRAAVVGSTNTSVVWSLSGAACSGAACGTVTSAGLYTAPSVLPSIATVVITATPLVDVSRSASAVVTLVGTANAKLNGQFAFQFTGLDSSGTYQAAGFFTADGNGSITAGIEDINRKAGALTGVALTGSYEMSDDSRGSITFNSSLGGQVYRFALNSGGTGGRFIEFDSSGVLGSGVFEAQDATAFTSSALNGPYVLSLSGKDSAGNRIGALGVCYFDGAGSIVAGSVDVNDGGKIMPTFSTIQGIYRIEADGRGLVDLNILGFGSGTFEFSLEVVSADKLILVSMDPLSSGNPFFGGIAELQTGAPFLSSSFEGPTVFTLGGESGNVPQVIVGQITFDGVDQPLVEFDENTGGNLTTGNVLTGAYSVGLNGAGTLNLDNSNGSNRTWVMYAISPNHAFLLDDSTSMASTGEIKPQSATTPFTALDILGGYGIGSGEPLVYGAPLYSGVSNFDGQSAVSGTEDFSVGPVLSADQSLNGTYTVSGNSNNGRGTLNLTSPFPSTIALWVVSDSEVVGVELDAGNTRPIVLYFEQ